MVIDLKDLSNLAIGTVDKLNMNGTIVKFQVTSIEDVESKKVCKECIFNETICSRTECCSMDRKDNEDVIFKKL